MRQFELEHRVGADTCAINTREYQNMDINKYNLYNYWKTSDNDCDPEVKKMQDFAVENYLHPKEGYGFTNGCRVDNDTQLRWETITADRTPTQLFTRIFQAVPDLSSGPVRPELESKLQQGEFTHQYHNHPCEDKNWPNYFTPMIPCLKQTVQDPKHIVEPWTRGGDFTRDTLKQEEFLKKNGYSFDGNVWSKKQC